VLQRQPELSAEGGDDIADIGEEIIEAIGQLTGKGERHQDWPRKRVAMIEAPRRMLVSSRAVPSDHCFISVTDSTQMIRAKEVQCLVRKKGGSRLRLSPYACRMRPTPGNLFDAFKEWHGHTFPIGVHRGHHVSKRWNH